MSTNFTPVILDYCLLWGGNPSNYNSWIPWLYKRVYSTYVSDTLTRFNQDRTYTTRLYAEGGYIGSARRQNNLYYDYWLKVDLGFGPEINKYRRIENLQLTYNGDADSSNWCAFIFKEQTDAICAPTNYPLEQTGTKFNWQCTTSTYSTPQNASTLISDNKMLAYAESNEGVFNFSFDLQGQNIVYINIKQKNDNASRQSAGTDSNLWSLTFSTENGNVIPKNSVITYYHNSPVDTTNNETVIAEKAYGIDYTIATSSFQETGYIFKYWKDDNNNIYRPGDSYTIDTDLNLYAIWEAKTYTFNLRVQRCEYNANGNITKQTLLTSNKIANYITVKINGVEDFPTIIKYGDTIDLEIECNDYCNLNPADTKNKSLVEFFPPDVNNKSKYSISMLGCTNDTEDNIQFFEINIYPKAYPVKFQDGREEVYYYGDVFPLTYTFKAIRRNIKPMLETPQDESLSISGTMQYNGESLLLTTWYTKLPSYMINSSKQWSYSPLGPSSVFYPLKFDPNKEDIKGWKYENESILNPPETEIEIKYTIPPIVIEVYYNLYKICLDDEEQNVPNNLWLQLPYGENGKILYWSLTKEGGMPHYCSGDYVSAYKNTVKLWSTSKNGKDFEIKGVNEINV